MECFLVVPGHPLLGIFEELGRVLLQNGDVFEGVDPAQRASGDQAHEQVPDEGPVLGAVE